MSKQRPPSRPQRWANAVQRASEALQDLVDIQQEFSDWKDNLPESLSSSNLADKLETVCDLDLQTALDTVGEAESVELPLGFGRD